MAHPYTEIKIRQEPFYLLPQKAIYRPLQKQLILSDLQNKNTDFKINELERVQLLIQIYHPETVLILGNLFDTQETSNWVDFRNFFQENTFTQFVLVEGNQALLPHATYKIENLIKIGILEESHLVFSHHPNSHPRKLNICGFLNPKLQLKKRNKEIETLSCFVLDTEALVLPVFGHKHNHLVYEKTWDNRCFIIHEEIVKELI